MVDRTRRCDIMFPEGETTMFGSDCVSVGLVSDAEVAEWVGEAGFPSVGVGGVMKVTGASSSGDGAAESWVRSRLGAVPLSEVLDCSSSSARSCGGEA